MKGYCELVFGCVLPALCVAILLAVLVFGPLLIIIRRLNATWFDPYWRGERRLRRLGSLVKDILMEETEEAKPDQLDDGRNDAVCGFAAKER